MPTSNPSLPKPQCALRKTHANSERLMHPEDSYELRKTQTDPVPPSNPSLRHVQADSERLMMSDDDDDEDERRCRRRREAKTTATTQMTRAASNSPPPPIEWCLLAYVMGIQGGWGLSTAAVCHRCPCVLLESFLVDPKP